VPVPRPKKAEGETVARLGLTLPPELKKEMDEVPEEVNWSAVAAEAFRRKLTQLQSEREATTMEEVIGRMRADEKLNDDAMHKEGRQAAEQWVMKRRAKPKELRRLDKAMEPFDHSSGYYVSVMANGMNRGPAVGIARDLFGDKYDASLFWKGVIGLGDDWRETADDVNFADGFVEKAMELWEQIEPKL
jgi:hypothetical protein